MEQNNNNSTNLVLEWIKKDITIIIVCLIALGCCYYTLYRAKDFGDRCNEYWMDQWDEKCMMPKDKYNMFMENFTIFPIETEGGQDAVQNNS